MTTGEYFMRKGNCKKNHCSAMSNSAWCDLNSKGGLLKLRDHCNNPKCKCQMQISFSPRHFQLEGSCFKKTMRNIFKGTERMWNSFIKPGLKIATPNFWASVAAKTKNPQSTQIKSKILKSSTGSKILSLTDMHGRGLRIKICKSFQKTSPR